LLIAAISNLLFAFTTSFQAMQMLWAFNGWGQSAGWALMVHTLSDWNTSARRGTLIGRLSTSYQVGHVLSWLLAGVLCDAVGWRAAFVVPGLFLLPVALVFSVLRFTGPAPPVGTMWPSLVNRELSTHRLRLRLAPTWHVPG
jgi:OPA family sugar phosphate sensor protein UhpC-like MFS transporter